MKTLNTLLFSLLILSSAAFAQNFNQNGYGVNQDLGRNSSPSKPSQQDIDENNSKQLDRFMEQLKKELSLDELQTIAIRNEVITNRKNVEILMKKESSEEEKSKQIKAMMDRTDVTINSYLNKDQKEKYKILTEKMKSGKKIKKGKKEEVKDEIKEDKTTEEKL
jgi:mannitol-specific phosphotransferase system IIBC component